jgi:spermidine synthase
MSDYVRGSAFEEEPEALAPLSPAARLFLAGCCALFWELALIRWLGSSIRIVAYYANFVLIAAFFGLGAGALLARYRIRLHRLLFPALALTIAAGSWFGDFLHLNLRDAGEYVWWGGPAGIPFAGARSATVLPGALLLAIVYVIAAFVFLIFGQWIGKLFRPLPPLRAYSIEIVGSIAGILLFTLLAYLGLSPIVWFTIGFALVLPLLDRNRWDLRIAVVAVVVAFVSALPQTKGFIWSPYYRIAVSPITSLQDAATKKEVRFREPLGYAVHVNNDYHQMLLGLGRGAPHHPFVSEWRSLYDRPYAAAKFLPPGPILIVGAGTGNDVAAALRNTDRRIYAVEIDPRIVEIGRRLHPEHPYDDPRVTVVVNDARQFFEDTDEQFALVVFGFLDSHTLLSNFSSLRLDNFVYTKESLEQVKRLLKPEGQVHLTFASNRPWIHKRFVALLDSVFDAKTRVFARTTGYTNGVVYSNLKAEAPRSHAPAAAIRIPTDDWPFLYLQEARIPRHYVIFMVLALLLASLSLLALPRGERGIRLPYFFLGAAFFLVETSNVIRLSLMYGSTWYVNVLVFTGILALVLLGNLTMAKIQRPRIGAIMVVLAASIGLGLLIPAGQLLAIRSEALQAIAAVLVYLGPVYCASLIFAALIRDEENLYQAYGSNVLGAVVGGVTEYFSLVLGFQLLLVITLGFYLAAYVAYLAGRRVVRA